MTSIELKNNRTKPLVSVCMITYNHEAYIEEAINGVLKQQVSFDVELIISNDCSTDNTNALIKSLIANDLNKRIQIKYFNHPKNMGMMSNFIFALEQCNCKYIALCEGDDYWTDPLKLEKQVDFLESRLDIDVCFTRAQILWEHKHTLQPILPEYIERPFAFSDLLKYHNFIITASVLFRKPKGFAIPNWFISLPYGDMGLYKLLSNSNNFYGLKDDTSVYRIHNEGVYSGIDKLLSRKTYYGFYKQIYPHLNVKERVVSKVQMRQFRKEIAQLKFPNNYLYRMLYYFYLELYRYSSN